MVVNTERYNMLPTNRNNNNREIHTQNAARLTNRVQTHKINTQCASNNVGPAAAETAALRGSTAAKTLGRTRL
eukprot:11165399-Lingulodinium_polyedra.AAC.1